MTTIADIITGAFREGNITAIGKTPNTDEINEALPRLNNLISVLFGYEIGEQLTDWPIPQPNRTAPVAARYPFCPGAEDLSPGVYTVPPSNVRLLIDITAATTVYFQENPNDGARMAYVDLGHTGALTLDGNGRFIEGADTKTIAVGDPLKNSPLSWFYRADLGDWILLKTLTTTDESPLPIEFDDLLISGLSMRLSARFGNEARIATRETFQRDTARLRQRYRQPTRTLGGASDIPNSEQSFDDDFGRDFL